LYNFGSSRDIDDDLQMAIVSLLLLFTRGK